MSLKSLLPLFGAAAALVTVSACAPDVGALGYRSAGVDYDGYYDDHYGPISDGYWGTDGAFYYQLGEGHAYHRDDARHVQHEARADLHVIHGHHSDYPKISDKPPRLNRSGNPAVNPLPKDAPRGSFPSPAKS